MFSSRNKLSLQRRIKSSFKHCRIKKRKETCSFPSRNPFFLYTFLFHWLSERYKFVESFPGVISFKRTSPHCFQKNKSLWADKSCRHSSSPAAFCSRPGNRLHGAGHQHDWCLQTTPRVAGINTSAGKACSCLSLPLYSKTLPADLQGKVYRTALVTKHEKVRRAGEVSSHLPHRTDIHSGSMVCKVIL